MPDILIDVRFFLIICAIGVKNKSVPINKSGLFEYYQIGTAKEKISDRTGNKYIECNVQDDSDGSLTFYLYKNKYKNKEIHPDYLASAKKETIIPEGLKLKRHIGNNFFNIGAAWINPNKYGNDRHTAVVLEKRNGDKKQFYLFKSKKKKKDNDYDITVRKRRVFALNDIYEEPGALLVIFIIITVAAFIYFVLIGKNFSF